jgi:hypothetical protein
LPAASPALHANPAVTSKGITIIHPLQATHAYVQRPNTLLHKLGLCTGPSLWVCTYRLGTTKGGLGVAPFLGSSLARKTCN